MSVTFRGAQNMNESRFSTQDYQLLYHAVRAGVPKQYIIPIIDEEGDGEKSYHNIRQILDDAYTKSVGYADVLKNFYTVYRHYSRYFSVNDREGRAPTAFLWLMIDVMIQRSRDAIENIVRAMRLFGMGKFDINSIYMDHITVDSYKGNQVAYQRELSEDQVALTAMEVKIRFLEAQYNSGNVPDLHEHDRIPSRFRYKPVLISNNREYSVAESDGLHIFEMSRATRFVPIITYMDNNGIPMRRVHNSTSGTSAGDITTYSTGVSMNQVIGRSSNITYDSITQPNNAKVLKPNYIIFTLWLGDPKNEGIPITSSPSNTIVSVAYKLNLGTMTLRIDIGHKARTSGLLAATRVTDPVIIAKRIAQAFPNLRIPNDDQHIIKIGYRGGFQLWNTSIKETLLLHQLLNDDKFLAYMYLDDRINSFYKSGVFNVRYMSKAVTQQRLMEEVGVKVTITPIAIGHDTRIAVNRVTPGGSLQQGEITYGAKTQYLEVGITKGVSVEIFELMIDVIRTLIGYHQSTSINVISRFYNDIGGYDNPNIEYSIRRGNTSFSYENYPHMIPSDYNTLCRDRPVIVLNNDEVATYIDSTGVLRAYPVIEYPPSQVLDKYRTIPRIRLRSNDPEHPYVNLKRTNDRSIDLNNQFYPCLSTEFSGVISETVVDSKEPTTIMTYGDKGILHTSVTEILKNITPIDKVSQDYMKIGTVRGNNSFLHSIIFALQRQRLSEDQTVNMGIAHRRLMANQRTIDGTPLHLTVGSQQFFDVELDEVKELLLGVGYLDPRLFMAIVEEFYNINVIHFHSKNYNDSPSLQIPRYREFMAYSYKPRRTIIILSSFGTRHTSSRNYPHCELIGQYNRNLNLEPDYIFSPQIGYSLMGIALELNRGLLWIDDERNIHRYVNPHSKINYRAYGIRIVGQRIDNFGKAYIVRFQHKLGTGVLAVPPHEPSNCPTMESITPLISLVTAVKIFGKPISCDVIGDNIVGLWYNININQEPLSNNPATAFPVVTKTQFSFYVCVREYPYKNQTIGPENYIRRLRSGIISGSGGIFDRYINLKKTNYMVKTLIKWLYEIEFINNRDYTPQSFLDHFIMEIQSELSRLPSPYDISGFTSQLPEFGTAYQALQWIQSIDPNMVVIDADDRFRFAIYTPAYLNDIEDEVIRYRKVLSNFSAEELVHGRENISGFYTPWEVSSVEGSNTIIRGEEEFQEWRSFQKYIESNRVYSGITEQLKLNASPFIYYQRRDESAVPTYYLIQNIIGLMPEQSKAKAYYVAHHWYYSIPRVNRIHDQVILDSKDVGVHIEAKILTNGTMQPVTYPKDAVLVLINYGSHWGAALPLGLVYKG